MSPDRKDLVERYARYSDDRLLEILYKKNEYTPLALEVVQEEVNKRQINLESVERFTAEKKVERIISLEKAMIPLNLWERILFTYGWFIPGFITGALTMNYFEDGLLTKIHQSKVHRVAGFIASVLSVIIDLSLGGTGKLGSLILWIGALAISLWIVGKMKTTTSPPE